MLAEVSPQLWWYVARSSGFVSWATVTLSVLWGLLLSTRLMGRTTPAGWLLEVHRFLGALSAVFLGVHLFALWADSYVHFGLAELFIPGKSDWNTEAVAWGVVAMYLIIAIEATSFLMHKIPRKAWRYVHFNAFAVYAFATVHAVRGGTDRTNPIFRWSAFASVQLVLFLLVVRILTTRRLKRALREQGGGSVDDRRADRLEALKARAESARSGRSQLESEPEGVEPEPTQVG
jgi:predicted ferric reductase